MYNISEYKTDAELVRKVQSGKGDELLLYPGPFQNLYIELIFSGTTPKHPNQDYITGRNDLVAAKAARYGFALDHQQLSEGYTNEWVVSFELYIVE